jgi:hypothetical protein
LELVQSESRFVWENGLKDVAEIFDEKIRNEESLDTVSFSDVYFKLL